MAIGFDAGTYNLVACKRNDKGDFAYRKEINAFLEMPTDNPFLFNMMKKAGVPLIQREDAKVAYALGEAAMDMAYTMPQIEVRRPMKDGCVNPKERDAFEIMRVMINGLLGDVSEDKTLVYYSIPANAINEETDADYHSKVLEAILKSYRSSKGYTVDARPINEALALVYAELSEKAFTGVGISCLLPGTMIYANKGIVPIETVQVGDMVFTHKARWRKVIHVNTKQYKGVANCINVVGDSEVTNEYKFVDHHELYVKRNNDWKWTPCDELVKWDAVGEPIEGGFSCAYVKSVQEEDYEGLVYDLTVEEDHSFSGPNLTIHNCGAGMVNVAFSLFAAPVFKFAIVNSGDWIDKQAAKATGETVAFINKEKHKIDLTKPPTSLFERAIQTQYNLMIEKTVTGLKNGIESNSRAARVENPVDFVIAGGTASPPGFEKLFKDVIDSVKLPIPVGNIIKPVDPLYSVARGALIAAENASC